MSAVRLMIVDQQPVVEKGLEHFLADCTDISICARAGSALAGLKLLQQVKVDIVVMDLAFPTLGGTEAIRLLLAEMPELAIVVYTARDDEASVFHALKAGARGYILKQSPLEELIAGIREVQRGGYALSPCLNPEIIKFYLNHRDDGDDQLAQYLALTDREKQVFRLLALGKQTDELATLLTISPKTVAKHRAAIKHKLGFKNSVEILHYAIRLGIVDIDET
ncbi:response regulator [Pelobacter seleniigenes]|uniref:response regulator n=1 Tax=Pelobacter seleniigenes TaxID=407188 RepID=UPI0004A7296B|nr:response regulator transcription factor [Pelobacter seleniigenes]